MAGSSAGNDALIARVQELLTLTGAGDASAANLLCDRHDPGALAYRMIADDLSILDLSYGELRARSEQFARGLRAQGIEPGDRVAALMGKSWQYLVALLGIWRLGAVYVPLFTAFAPAAIAFRLRESGTRLVICDAAQQPKLAPGEDMPADAPWRVVTTGPDLASAIAYDALMSGDATPMPAAVTGGDAPIIHIFTSGTTGKPKGVVVPLRALASFQAYGEFGLGLEPGDLYWCGADPGWAYGLYFGILASLSTGTPSLLLHGGFTPETTLAVLAGQGVTNFAAAPTVYRALRTSGVAVPPGLELRKASSAGEPLTPEVNEWATTALGIPILDHYGQTEAGMLINNHHHPLLRQPIKPGSMGHVMPGWSAAVLDEHQDEPVGPGVVGRVAMDLHHSPLAWFERYEGDPAKSAEKFAGAGRWYITGDTGWIDEEGYFHFSARDDDVIIMAGYRIGPFDVESVIAAHPAVAECAVIATPDEVRGEVIEAFVVLRDGAAGSDALGEEVKVWVKTRYAAHAYPRRVHFVDELPKTPSGKIQRVELRERRRREIAATPARGGR
ncbi:AMP-binding protein [Sphingomonas sp. MG17]|uniref:AMP-binding protein n=1 Tax=Sphingomonas tagetis TaxID=2949092 RepID=A0A9X2HP72_9SPHN|nr:AMP-binding protein [Sphingomonas tagetis]MCP3731239.1 AMP-binding protein [Sphingomonas tagetis]